MSLETIEATEAVPSTPLRPPFTERGALRLFVRREPFFSNLRDSLATIAARERLSSSHPTHYFARAIPAPKLHYRGRSAGLSVLLHVGLVALLVYTPSLVPAENPSMQSMAPATERIYYRIPLRQIKPPRRSGTTRAAHSAPRSIIAQASNSGSTAPRPMFPVASKPARPDNFRQTIFQAIAPPDITIKTEQKLPNIILMERQAEALKAPLVPSYARPFSAERESPAVAAPAISTAKSPNINSLQKNRDALEATFVPSYARPVSAAHQASAAAAPTISTANSPNISLQQNKEALEGRFVPSYARPVSVAHQSSATAEPTISNANSPNSVASIMPVTGSNPKLPFPVAGGGIPLERSGTALNRPPSNAPDLIVVGLDPSKPTSELSLPIGNRWGEFSIAPPVQPAGPANGIGGKSNSPAGMRASTDDSNAPGRNGAKRISSSSVSAGPVTIGGSGKGGSGLLSSALPISLVYPVVQPAIAIRRNPMVISTGALGGGGLNVYGALHCGKIYSIFLPMPGEDWSLQYCDRSATAGAAAAGSTVIHIESPMVPPDADLDHRYNFKRIPVTGPNANRPIILKGVIGADGSVHKLVVYQGVSPELDEAARIAFSRWHFKPAMRGGKPVSVEILVGIPPARGDDRLSR